MAKAHAGFFPGRSSQFKAVNRGRKLSTFTDNNGMEWDLTSGWHYQRDKGWTKEVKSSNVKTKRIFDLNGKQHNIRVYDTDFDDSIHFHATPQVAGLIDDRLDEKIAYAESALDEDDPTNGRIWDTDNDTNGCGDGHIKRMKYAEKALVLEVTFSNGDVAYFFRLPDQVAGQLFHLAATKAVRYVNGKKRHLLGITFWDLVRIRGSRTGAHYPFEYDYTSSFKNRVIAKHQKRHLIANGSKTSVIDDDLIDEFEKQKTAFKRDSFYNSATSGGTVSDEIYRERAVTEKGELLDKKGRKVYEKTRAYTFNEDAILDAIIAEQEGRKKEEVPEQEYKTIKHKIISDVREDVQSVIDFLQTNDPVFQDVIDRRNANYALADAMLSERNVSDDLIKWKALKMTADDLTKTEQFGDLNKAMSVARYNNGNFEALNPSNEREFDQLARLHPAIGKGNVHSWKKENTPGTLAATYEGRVWNIDKLKKVSPLIDDLRVRATYDKYIENSDWEAAFNLLKSTGNRKTIKNKRTGEVKTVGKTVNFASNNDTLDISAT